MMDSLAKFLFRRRDVLFPLVFLGLLAAFPPTSGLGGWLFWAGCVAVAAGQALRVITIGLDYVKRGGKDGKFFAHGLVTGGIFAHCRNPLYAGNLAIAFGFLMIAGNPVALALGAAFALGAYTVITLGEERYLRERFGDAYRDYCNAVPRWLPHPRGLVRTLRAHRFDWSRVLRKEYGTLYTSLMIPLALCAWKLWRAGGGDALVGALPWLASLAVAATAAHAGARHRKKSRRRKPPAGTDAPQPGVEPDTTGANG